MRAEETGVSEAKISDFFKKCNIALPEDFSPFLYNIWNTSQEVF